MTQDLVSVIVPNFNRGNTISRSLDSVLSQTYSPVEVIVVDDGSTDDSEAIVKARFGDRVTWFRHEARKGAAAARNAGIRLAKGKYIAFQDSDDEWLPGKLEEQMKVFSEASPEVGVVYTRLNKVIRGKNYAFPGLPAKKINGAVHGVILRQNLVGLPTAVVRRECFEKEGFFDESLPRLHDWDLFIRLSKRSQFVCVDKRLVDVREGKDSLSADSASLIKAVELLLAKHASDFNSGPSLEIAARYCRLGWMLAAEGEYETAREYWSRAMRSNPLYFKAGLFYMASFAGKRFHDFLRGARHSFKPARAGGAR